MIDDKLVEFVAKAIHQAIPQWDQPFIAYEDDEDKDSFRECAKAAIQAYEQHLKDQGKVIVDREPPNHLLTSQRRDYKAMIEASEKDSGFTLGSNQPKDTYVAYVVKED